MSQLVSTFPLVVVVDVAAGARIREKVNRKCNEEINKGEIMRFFGSLITDFGEWQ